MDRLLNIHICHISMQEYIWYLYTVYILYNYNSIIWVHITYMSLLCIYTFRLLFSIYEGFKYISLLLSVYIYSFWKTMFHIYIYVSFYIYKLYII